MFKRIKRAYYQWVIRNCIKDIQELHELAKRTVDPREVRWMRLEIRELRNDMDRARAKL